MTRTGLPNANWNDLQCVKDRKMGRINENWFETWLEESGFFKTDWETRKCKTNWDIIDYKSIPDKDDKIIRYIEVKSRRKRLNDHYDTMIGKNKLDEARVLMEKGCKVYFFFLFTGKYNKEKELYFYDAENCRKKLQYRCTIRNGGTDKRGKSEYKPHLYIPVAFLHSVKQYKDIMHYHRKNPIN